MALRLRLVVSIWLALLLGVFATSSARVHPAARLRDARIAEREDAIPFEDDTQHGDVPEAEPATPAQQRTAPLECFQVAQPVLGPSGPVYQSAPAARAPCTQLLMEHSFGFSYGKPFIGSYTPPNCEFNRVIMNFTVTSAGRQFDRLALMYFGDTEVWRTSTAEPRQAPGIVWTYWKDMTEYLYFWKSPQKLIFDLGNLIDDKYTGPFNTTLTATFFTSDVKADHAPPADPIIPISARNGSNNAISAWNVPEQTAQNTIDFPRNVRRAVFSVSANGQQGEEFWWSNVLESDAKIFAPTIPDRLPGLSPFREVQVLVDGRLAGVQWPFPVIFTGGVSPSFHRPIVGINAFDLPEHEIDITPWLPLLCDGKPHTFKIQVGGFDDRGDQPRVTDTVASYWVVTGKIFVWLDDEGSVTTGMAPNVTTPQPAVNFTHTTGRTDGNISSLDYSIDVRRTVSVTGQVKTTKGVQDASWLQSLAYRNLGSLKSYGDVTVNTMNITGMDAADGPMPFKTIYSYPLFVNATYTVDRSGAFSIRADMYQGYDLQVQGASVFPSGLEALRKNASDHKASKLSTYRDGSAYFYQSADGKSGSSWGRTRQELRFGGLAKVGDDAAPAPLYFRDVSAANDSVTSDKDTRTASVGSPAFAVSLVGAQPAAVGPSEFAPVPHRALRGLRAFLGRGQEAQAASRDAQTSGVSGQTLLD